MTTHVEFPTHWIAQLLTGAWRRHPPPLELTTEQVEAMTPILIGSGAGALAWWRISHSDLINGEGLLASSAASDLQQSYKLHSLQSALYERDIKRCFIALRDNSIEPVLVKGWVNAQYYAEKGLRSYGDIDLCIHRTQHKQAKDLILHLSERRSYVEVHDGFPDLDDPADLSYEDIMACTSMIQIEDVEVRVLSAEDHLRLLCIHFLRHGAWRPTWLCDIAAAVESRPADFDWQRCLGPDQRRADYVACAIGLAHELLSLNIEETPVADRARHLPRWLIPAVLKAWERPCGIDHRTPVTIRRSFQAAQLPKILSDRWFNPIEATVLLRGSFNDWTRLPWQLGMYGVRFGKFLTRRP